MPMRILITADPELPVPPEFYGGIERIIDMLARGLVDRGHEVILLAHRDSKCGVPLIPWPGLNSQSAMDTGKNTVALVREVLGSKFDLVHSFSRVAYLTPILPLSIPKLMTYQRAVSPRSVHLGRWLSRGTLEFSAISHWMMAHVEQLAPWHVVPNGVSLETYTFRSEVREDAPLVFLGRIEEIKGPHLAIQVAKQTGRQLLIAGNVPKEKREWFEQNVAPHIDDHSIRYVGPVDDRVKNELLGQAAALLMPILWEEPFGIVMAEAMACGTPVLGLNRGAVPEVIVDGVTGYVCENTAGLVSAVEQLSGINRMECRRRVENTYSEEAVVKGYLNVYQQMCGK